MKKCGNCARLYTRQEYIADCYATDEAGFWAHCTWCKSTMLMRYENEKDKETAIRQVYEAKKLGRQADVTKG